MDDYIPTDLETFEEEAIAWEEPQEDEDEIVKEHIKDEEVISQGAKIFGHIITNYRGKDADHIKVYLYLLENRRKSLILVTTTDKNGFYSIESLNEGTYIIRAEERLGTKITVNKDDVIKHDMRV